MKGRKYRYDKETAKMVEVKPENVIEIPLPIDLEVIVMPKPIRFNPNFEIRGRYEPVP